MALTASYGEPTYNLQNATDLTVALPVSLQDELGKEVASFVATATVNKDNPEAKSIISTLLATDIKTHISDEEDRAEATLAVGKDLLVNVAAKVSE